MGRPKRRRSGGRVTPKQSVPRYDDGRSADAAHFDGDYLYEVQVQAEHPHSASGTAFELEALTREAANLIEQVSGAGAVYMDEADYGASPTTLSKPTWPRPASRSGRCA